MSSITLIHVFHEEADIHLILHAYVRQDHAQVISKTVDTDVLLQFTLIISEIWFWKWKHLRYISAHIIAQLNLCLDSDLGWNRVNNEYAN